MTTTYTRQDLQEALQGVGVGRDTPLVYVHADSYAAGRPEGVTRDEIPSMIYSTLRRQIGPQGTIATPAFYRDFKRGRPFNRYLTPAADAEGGHAFAEYVRQLLGASRTPHAIHSIALDGPLAMRIGSLDTPSAFQEGGSFDALLEHDAVLVSIGYPTESYTFLRLAEERVGVPHRHWIEYEGPYIESHIERDVGAVSTRAFLDYSGHDGRTLAANMRCLREVLADAGVIRQATLGASHVEACHVRDFFRVATESLRADPQAFLAPHLRLDVTSHLPGILSA